MVTRRKYLTKEDLDAGIADLRKGLADLRKGLANLRKDFKNDLWVLDKDFERRLGVAIETIRADIKAFGELRTVSSSQDEIPEVERLSKDLEMVKSVVREHSKDIAELKAKR